MTRDLPLNTFSCCMCGAGISWRGEGQASVALSTAEAGFVARVLPLSMDSGWLYLWRRAHNFVVVQNLDIDIILYVRRLVMELSN